MLAGNSKRQNDNAGRLAFNQAIGFRILRWRKGAFAEVIDMKNLHARAPLKGSNGAQITDVNRLSQSITL